MPMQRANQTYSRRFVVICALALGLMLVQWGIGNVGEPWLLAFGRLFGFVATFCILLQLLLQSRLPGLERSLGLRQLLKIHRYNGYFIFFAILLHPIMITLAYAGGAAGAWDQFLSFARDYQDMLRAIVAVAVLLVIIATSIYMTRSRLPYELWYFIHLNVYAAVLLSFGHQLRNGAEFLSSPWFVAYWYVLYGTVLGMVAWFRFGRPLWRLVKHRFRVDRVVEEAPGVYSIYISAREVEKLGITPGQFYIWRFLDRKRWWQSHPFSVSALPARNRLRLTFKAVGGFTHNLARVERGTLVMPEGPHGTFTLDSARGKNLLFIGGGIGITPLRSMIEALPVGYNAQLIWSLTSDKEAFLQQEFADFQAKGVKVNYVYSDKQGRLSPELIKAMAPDAAQREVFLCGPPTMMRDLSMILTGIGVNKKHIYTERFAL